jgi:hypothetical protein
VAPERGTRRKLLWRCQLEFLTNDCHAGGRGSAFACLPLVRHASARSRRSFSVGGFESRRPRQGIRMESRTIRCGPAHSMWSSAKSRIGRGGLPRIRATLSDTMEDRRQIGKSHSLASSEDVFVASVYLRMEESRDYRRPARRGCR